MKKIIPFLLCLTLIVSVFSFSVFAVPVHSKPEEPEFEVIPGTYTFTRSFLIASVSEGLDYQILGDGVRFETERLGNISVTYMSIMSLGDSADVVINSIFANTNSSGLWYNVANNNSVGNIIGSKLIFDEVVYSQALLDFLMLNTDYEEINLPEPPIVNVPILSGLYAFDILLADTLDDGEHPFVFTSNGYNFDGISKSGNILSYIDEYNDAYVPVYDFSTNEWLTTEYVTDSIRYLFVTSTQQIDQDLSNFITNNSSYIPTDVFNFLLSQGYDNGYDKGYSDGVSLGESNAFVNGFFGDFFSGIREALDSFVLYQSTNTPIPIVVTLWNVLSTIIMLLIVLFVLKLVAGG